jgi:hypothetical protein
MYMYNYTNTYIHVQDDKFWEMQHPESDVPFCRLSPCMYVCMIIIMYDL